MDEILDGLNSAQLVAVTSPADVVQILAPPGSGKTKTLTSRVAYLIRHLNYKPWNILCLTFTIKSSREMKERLAKLIGNGAEAKLVLGTFHSVCRRYLVSYGHLIGIAKSFGIADSSDTLSVIKRIVKRLRLNLDPKVAQSRISGCKSKGVTAAQLSNDASTKKKVNQQEFAQVFEAYEDQLDQANLLDYDDLLLRCRELLRQHPLCVSNVEAVLIDEFQDTNVVQFDLMTLFAARQKRVTTVGDPDQSIYGWRSAEIKNLERMQTQYPETLIIHLQDNYRSSGAILLAAQELIQQDDSRPLKSLLPTHCPGTLPVLRRLPSSDAEAAWIVSEIKRTIGMTGGMLTYPDIAILLRSASLSRQIESAMGRAGIPYRMVGGQRFFDRVEIKILLDYLRIVSQPTNNDAIARVINVPARGVGNTTIKALLEEAETKKVTLWSLILDAVRGNIKTSTKITKPAAQGLGAFVQIILSATQKLKDPVDPSSPQSLLQHIIKKIKFQEYIKRWYELDCDGRWVNVEELISQAAEYSIPLAADLENPGMGSTELLPAIEGIAQSDSKIGEETLSMFLANVALATELQTNEGSENGEIQAQVTISTIHAAKGLEWPVVFVPAAYEGSMPHSRAEDTDEERRLLYVAMTRAQALLYISCPIKTSKGDESTLSQFLNPKTIGHYLVNVGPCLNPGLVNDIARILKRDCPSEDKMLEGVLALKNREDDLWPLDGQENPEQMKSRWDNKINNAKSCAHQDSVPATVVLQREQNSDRCRTSNVVASSRVVVGGTTTMDNVSSFSVHPFGGFTSAIVQLEKEQDLSQREKRVTGQRSRQLAKDNPNPTSRKRKSSDNTQSTLVNLWGSQTQSIEPSASLAHPRSSRLTLDKATCDEIGMGRSSTHKLSRSSTTTSALSDPSLGFSRGDANPRRTALAGIPENLARHALQYTATASRPRLPTPEREQSHDQYVFLSSSPPLLETASQSRSAAAGEMSVGGHGNAKARHGQDENAALIDNDLRPAITMHTTSLAPVQARHAARKTLGVRRSMNGWNTKSGQGFSVPRRVQ
ncbi:MAG: hypothetical protein Q9182_004337 [Xanthomendoza sp. 2 TL-2023]